MPEDSDQNDLEAAAESLEQAAEDGSLQESLGIDPEAEYQGDQVTGEEYDEEADEELITYLAGLVEKLREETEEKEDVRDRVNDLVDDYAIALADLEAMEEQRDEYRQIALDVIELGVEYIEGDRKALEKISSTLEEAGYDPDVEFYNTGGVHQAMDALRDTVDDSLDRFDDF